MSAGLLRLAVMSLNAQAGLHFLGDVDGVGAAIGYGGGRNVEHIGESALAAHCCNGCAYLFVDGRLQ